MKKFKKVTVVLSAILLMSAFTGCKPDGLIDDKPIDKTKTQLYVFNYNGGVGTEWLEQVKVDFEKKYANHHFADGKTGVQVHIEPSKNTDVSVNSIYSVIFTQGVRIFSDISQGKYLNITDIVTESLSELTDGAETGTIEDRLSPELKSTLTAVDGEYYCLPHYETYDGIFYDIDVFEEYGLYFLEGGGFCEAGAFDAGEYIGKGKLSVGPDGERNTSDDGMPSSYEEFFSLIDYMVKQKVVPFIWTGEYAVSYQYKILNGVWGSVAGRDQMLQNFNFDSNLTGKKVLSDVAYSFKDGEPVVEQAEVSLETGWQTSAQVGKYYGLKLLEKIVSNSSNYSSKITKVFSHLDAQEEFIYSNLENEPIAMLVEGSYWYNEAADALKRSENTYKDRAKNRRFAMMELPRIAKGQVSEGNGTKNTLCDMLESYAFISSKVKDDPEQLAVSKKFLQFAYTEEQLQKFTISTGTFRALNYYVSEKQLSGLDNYKKSIVELRQKSDVVRPLAHNDLFVNQQLDFMLEYGTEVYKAKIGGTTYQDPLAAMKDSNISAESYFLGTIRSQSDWDKKYSSYYKK